MAEVCVLDRFTCAGFYFLERTGYSHLCAWPLGYPRLGAQKRILTKFTLGATAQRPGLAYRLQEQCLKVSPIWASRGPCANHPRPPASLGPESPPGPRNGWHPILRQVPLVTQPTPRASPSSARRCFRRVSTSFLGSSTFCVDFFTSPWLLRENIPPREARAPPAGQEAPAPHESLHRVAAGACRSGH